MKDDSEPPGRTYILAEIDAITMTPYNFITLLHSLIMKQQGVRTDPLTLLKSAQQDDNSDHHDRCCVSRFDDPVLIDPVLAAMTRQAFMDRTVKGMASRQTVMYDGRQNDRRTS